MTTEHMTTERQVRVRIGLFVLASLIALAVLIVSLNREGSLLTGRYTLYADFDNVEGLFSSAPVLLAGNRVGRVQAISFLPLASLHAVRVTLDIEGDVQYLIRTDSSATILQAGPLGDMYVSIALGTLDYPPLEPQSVLPTHEPVPFHELTARGSAALDEVTKLAAQMHEMAALFDQVAGVESTANLLRSFDHIVEEIERGSGLLHQLIYAETPVPVHELEQTLRTLRSGLQRFDGVLREVQSGGGVAHDLIYGASPGGQSEVLVTREILLRTASVLRKLDEGEGTLGALLDDPSVYEELKLLLSGAQQSALLRALLRVARE